MYQKHKCPDALVLAEKWELIKADLAAAGVRVLTKNRRQRTGVMIIEPTFVGTSAVIDLSQDLLYLSERQKEYVRLAQKRSCEYLIESDPILQRVWHKLLHEKVEAWLQAPLEEELKAAKGKVGKVRRKPSDQTVATVEGGGAGSEAAPSAKRVRGKGKETKEQKALRLRDEEVQRLLAEKLAERGLISTETHGRTTPTLQAPSIPAGP